MGQVKSWLDIFANKRHWHWGPYLVALTLWLAYCHADSQTAALRSSHVEAIGVLREHKTAILQLVGQINSQKQELESKVQGCKERDNAFAEVLDVISATCCPGRVRAPALLDESRKVWP